MKATSSAVSCSVKTVIGPDGVTGTFIPAEGGLAFFESEVRMAGQHKFTETGNISFGDDHVLNFSTVGEGHLAPVSDGKTLAGAVTWKIDGGEGQFANATGYITSNFLVLASGELTDYHFGVIFLQG